MSEQVTISVKELNDLRRSINKANQILDKLGISDFEVPRVREIITPEPEIPITTKQKRINKYLKQLK